MHDRRCSDKNILHQCFDFFSQTECHRKADLGQTLGKIQCTDIASPQLALVFIHLFSNNQISF